MFCPYPPHTRFAPITEIVSLVTNVAPDAVMLVALGLFAVVVIVVVVLMRAVRRVQVLTAAAVSAMVPAAAWGLGGVVPVSLETAGRGAGGAVMIAASCALLWAAYRVGRRF